METCPTCAKEVPEDMTTWLVAGKFYCSEHCAAVAAGARKS